MKYRSSRRGWVLAVGILSAMLLSACGANAGVATLTGENEATPIPSISAASGGAEEALLALTECMRENGIDLPDPVFGGVGEGGGRSGDVVEARPGGPPPFDPTSDQFRAAQQACGHHLEGLGLVQPGAVPELSADEEEAFLAFTECMRERGINMRDPVNGAIVIHPEDNLDPMSAEFRTAEEACRSHLEGMNTSTDEEVEP